MSDKFGEDISFVGNYAYVSEPKKHSKKRVGSFEVHFAEGKKESGSDVYMLLQIFYVA
jgi:hypothetical protein